MAKKTASKISTGGLSYITMEQLENKRTRNIYVVNTTPADKRANLIFTVQGTGGRLAVVMIPQTWLPVRVTDSVAAKDLLNSMEFRRAIDIGVLRLVDEISAQVELAKPENQEEIQNIAMEKSQLVSGTLSTFDNSAPTQAELQEDEEIGVNRQVISFMTASGERGEDVTITALRRLGTLKLRDLRYVRNKAKGANQVKLVDWSRREITKLKEAAGKR
jgi:hypothetical protein